MASPWTFSAAGMQQIGTVDLGAGGAQNRDHTGPQAETLGTETFPVVRVTGPAQRSGTPHRAAGANCLPLAIASHFLELSVSEPYSGQREVWSGEI